MNPNKSKYNIKDWLSNQNAGGFKDGNTNPSLNDYEYDENDFRVKDFEKVFYEETERSSMIKDRNKGIENITYNHLNLPVEIKWTNNKKINYLYTATGVKVQKKVTNGTNIRTTDYLDGFQYNQQLLEFFPHLEGYVKATALSESPANPQYAFNYVYNYTDHLGNVRVSYTKDPQTGNLKILDESHYYPFGLKHSEYAKYGLIEQNLEVVIAPVTDNPFKYKYQGQELQDELGLNWYSYKYRNYDPAIGRFFNVDPLTEKYVDWGPYVFSGNRVIDARELEGLEPVEVGKDTQFLVITVNGRAGGMHGDKIQGNNTLVKNLPSPYNQGDDGLSLLGQKPFNVNGATVINYAGSDSGVTAGHIAETIRGFKENNPDGKIALIGHSLGGKDALNAANIASDVTIDVLITMEAASAGGMGSSFSTSVGGNVQNLINFDSAKSSYTGGGGIAGSGTNSTNITLPTGTDHTNMDQTLLPYLAPILNHMSNGVNPVDLTNKINFNNATIYRNGDFSPNKTEGTSY